jgi:glyoxylate carboligase
MLKIIVEHVTNTSLGTELDKVMGFEELVLKPEDAPSAVKLLD